MKNFLLGTVCLSAVLLAGCGSGDKSNSGNGLKAKADSLYQDVIHGHDEGMVGWMKIEDKKKAVQHLLDSIGTLPQKVSEGVATIKEKASGVMQDLQSAYNDMDTWMRDMNLDSAVNNLEQRIKYLAEEKLKAATIKEAINNSLKKADSLLSNFR